MALIPQHTHFTKLYILLYIAGKYAPPPPLEGLDGDTADMFYSDINTSFLNVRIT